MNFYDLFMLPLEKIALRKYRRILISKAQGHVLEIGFGTGANLEFYPGNELKSLTAIDLDVSNADSFLSKASPESSKEVKRKISFTSGKSEELPFTKESFDTVVETLVFCSVEDLSKSISEVHRVLKPGGIFLFMDHVLPEKKPWKGLFMQINPLWIHLAHGCHLTRSPHRLLEQAGFEILHIGSFGKNIFRYGTAKKIT
jgi:ubiquinone/menaquinone biosynthesis C-methylase UbiE